MYTRQNSLHDGESRPEDRIYTFNTCISRPIAITNHSPGPVECPVFSVIEFIYGDHAIFDISPPLV